MTCIVGVETEDGVLLAADSMAGEATYWTANVCVESKVFRIGDYVIGFTTSFRMGQLLRYGLALPAPSKGRLHRHMVSTVVPAIRACFKEGGFATTKDGGEVGGSFLVGVRGHLFHVQSDYQVGRSPYGYGACGCGAQSALGALSANGEREPRVRLREALEAAEKHNMGVRRPWRFAAERLAA